MIANRTVKIEIRNQYGKDCFYPGCENAEKFLRLTGKKTFNESDLHTIIELGFIVTRSTNDMYENIFKG